MATTSYYFDGSDVAAADPDGVWTDETNTDDGNPATFASTTTQGSNSTNEIVIEGTNAPGAGPIVKVLARFYGASGLNDNFTSCDITTQFYTNAKAESLGTATISGHGAGAWSDWTTLTVPTGGWDWTKIQALESVTWQVGNGIEGGVSFSRVEVGVVSITGNPIFFNNSFGLG